FHPMLAIIYLALTFWLGDLICRRFHRLLSAPHRLAAAFLVGLLFSTWFTYLTARVFAATTRPLLWCNLLFLLAVIAIYSWTRRKEFQANALKGELIAATEASTINSEITSDQLPAARGAAENTPKAAGTADERDFVRVAETESESGQPYLDEYVLRPTGSN